MVRLSVMYVLRSEAILLILMMACCVGERAAAAEADSQAPHPVHFIDSSIENGSPLWWELADDQTVRIHLTYDQERCSPNRANGHWLFRVEAEPGADVTLDLGPFGNVWNGTLARPVPEAKVAYVSDDGQEWRPVRVEPSDPFRLKLQVHMSGPSLYVARLQPYRISDLEKWKAAIARHPLVKIETLGKTVEGRDLELIRVGRPDAPHRILLRARAHAWEPGGNWVLEGLVARLLGDDAVARKCTQLYAVDILPMANKDGVARGRTRFNLRGMDLNRQWDKPADPELAPENAALEKWLDAVVASGQRPDLALDFHNDASGLLHISRPEIESGTLTQYVADMERLERLLRAHSWFTEGSTKGSFHNPGTMGEGLLARYGIPACIHELNANWIAGRDDFPSAAHWKQYGGQLAEVFCRYLAGE